MIDLEGGVTKWLARQYNSGTNWQASFDAGWSMARTLARSKESKEHHKQDGIDHANTAAQRIFAASLPGSAGQGLGYDQRRWARDDGRYVIFSDHHITYSKHKQDFFAARNVGLYVHALKAYDDAGFTVVENGDVEELVIFDPKDHPGEMGARAEIIGNAGSGAHISLPDAFLERRRRTRLEILDRILADAKLAPYRAAAKALADDGRLVRVAGNHDYDLQRPEFLQKLTDKLGVTEVVDLFYLSADGNPGNPTYVMCHGHQFDATSNPHSAPRFGETYSETAGVWFHGADRQWRWDQDFPKEWATGKKAFRNKLVDDGVDGTASLRPDEDIDAETVRLIKELSDELGLATASLQFADPNWWQRQAEKLFGHAVGWEHFVFNPKVLKIIFKEVYPAERFFKYRHTDELMARRTMRAAFGNNPPTLVLGHSHEPRLNALDANGNPFDAYLNSAAAGRFERLIWAIEIDGGEDRVVTWADHGGGTIERRVWTDQKTAGELWAGDAHEDIP